MTGVLTLTHRMSMEQSANQIQAIHDCLMGKIDGSQEGLVHQTGFIRRDVNSLKESVNALKLDVDSLKKAEAERAAYSKGKKAGMALGYSTFGAAIIKAWDALSSKIHALTN